ncbi:MAG: tRNA 2-thiouridine(34) synthase MnmA [Lentisphaeria bacterium]|nr:tRNA 2-thiouridine(34) synthase MnmA [Lentisphaeria bacterium]
MKVVAALSGGVDSSVAAALMQRAGHQVVGVTLRLKHPDPVFSASQLCAGKSDEESVLAVCRKLQIESRFIEGFDRFSEHVLYPAAREYLAGRTPNPCCRCNEVVKFALLAEFADRIGAGLIVTGHYAGIDDTNGIRRLMRGDDPLKDQSYFLYRLDRTILDRVDFPVGRLCKAEVRQIAAELGLSTAERPDSQDACFQVPGESFGETLRRLFALPCQDGQFFYQDKAVGRHRGIHQFTIGQRKGMNVALGKPAYIRSIDPATNGIELVTDPAGLMIRAFHVGDLILPDGLPERAEVQIRYRSKPVLAAIRPAEGGALVIPDQPLRAVTPGQAAVFYHGRILLGGGTIGGVEYVD